MQLSNSESRQHRPPLETISERQRRLRTLRRQVRAGIYRPDLQIVADRLLPALQRRPN